VEPLVIRAPAKINLCLDVLGRRPDGYHEVATILQTIDLADRLRIVRDDDVVLHCHGMGVDQDNLILRAANLLREHAGIGAGCSIECWKRIPIGAGLGGGSADAAAALVGLNTLWKTGLRINDLSELAAKLGADVPFFLHGGTALATGIGTALRPLRDAPRHWLVLVPIEADDVAKSANMYRALTTGDFGDSERARRQAAAVELGRIAYADVGSSFTRPAAARWRAVTGAMDSLAQTSPLAVSLSGAGPSVFALYASRAAARAAQRAIGPPATVRMFRSSAESDVRRFPLSNAAHS